MKIKEIIIQIKEKVPLSWILERYCSKLEKVKYNTYRTRCPFHKEDTSSFFIFDEKANFHCFGCKAHGDMFDFIQKKYVCSLEEAIEIISNMMNLNIKIAKKEEKKRNENYVQYLILKETCKWFQKQLFQHVEATEFLKMRGLLNYVEEYKIGFAPNNLQPLINNLELVFTQGQIMKMGIYDYTKYMRNRIIFPIINHKNEIISFCGRTINNNKAKYINSANTSIFSKSKHLYGIKNVLSCIEKERRVIFVEGIVDTITMQKHGNNTTVGMMGTNFNVEWFKVLALTYKVLDFYFILDSDTAGKNSTLEIIKKILPLVTRKHNIFIGDISPFKDPDEYIFHNQDKHILDQCIPLSLYLFQQIKEKLGVSVLKYLEQMSQFSRIKNSVLSEINDSYFRFQLNRQIEKICYFELVKKKLPEREKKMNIISDDTFGFSFAELLIKTVLEMEPALICDGELQKKHHHLLLAISSKNIIPQIEEKRIIKRMIEKHGTRKSLYSALLDITHHQD